VAAAAAAAGSTAITALGAAAAAAAGRRRSCTGSGASSHLPGRAARTGLQSGAVELARPRAR